MSGKLPHHADGTVDPDANFEIQAGRALRNVLAIIGAAGGGSDTVVRMVAYIAELEDWSAFDRLYAELRGALRPARVVVPVA